MRYIANWTSYDGRQGISIGEAHYSHDLKPGTSGNHTTDWIMNGLCYVEVYPLGMKWHYGNPGPQRATKAECVAWLVAHGYRPIAGDIACRLRGIRTYGEDPRRFGPIEPPAHMMPGIIASRARRAREGVKT